MEDKIGLPIPQQISNILVIRPGALGDFVLTLPVFAYLRRQFPQARIEVMGYSSIAEMIVGRYYADGFARFDQPEVSYLFLDDLPLPECLEKYLSRFDMIISFLQERVFVENLRRVSTGCVLSQNPLPQPNGTTHAVEHLLSAVGGWGEATAEERTPRVFLKEEDKEWASDFLDKHLNHSTPIVAMHLGSGGRKKCWPVEGFICLAFYLRKELGVQLLLVSGPADEEVTGDFLNYTQPRPPLLHNLPLPKLAAILERCDLFIGNDSGVTHLAAATGVATLALFGPTSPAVWGPRGERVRIVQGNPPQADCSPCSPEERGRCQRPACMEVITVGQIIRTVEEVLGIACPNSPCHSERSEESS